MVPALAASPRETLLATLLLASAVRRARRSVSKAYSPALAYDETSERVASERLTRSLTAPNGHIP